MNGTLPILFLSLGLAVSPAQKTEINAVQIVKQEVQAQTETETKQIQLTEKGLYLVMGKSNVTDQDLVQYFKDNGADYPAEILKNGGAPDLETFCKLYVDEAVKENVRPEVAFAQAMKETGFLRFGGDASIEQFNFSGLGATGGGVPGNSFPDVQTGIRAQIQHLKAYATDEELNEVCVDERYSYVAKGCAPYVEWLGQQENPDGYGWAAAEDYGSDIIGMIEKIQAIQAD